MEISENAAINSVNVISIREEESNTVGFQQDHLQYQCAVGDQ